MIFFCPWIYMVPPSRGSFSFLTHHAFVSGSFPPLKIPSNSLYFPRNVDWSLTNLGQVIYPTMPTSTGMKQNSQLGQAKVLSAIIVTLKKKKKKIIKQTGNTKRDNQEKGKPGRNRCALCCFVIIIDASPSIVIKV